MLNAILLKLVTGELIIGKYSSDLDKQMNSGTVSVKDPVQIVPTSSGTVLMRWNTFSKLNTVMIMETQIVYVDVPSDKIVESYNELLNPKMEQTTKDEHGKSQTLH